MNNNIDGHSRVSGPRDPIAGPALLARILESRLSGPDSDVHIGRILIYETLFNRWLADHRGDFSPDELAYLVICLDDAWGHVDRAWRALIGAAAAISSDQSSAAGITAGMTGDERIAALRTLQAESGLLEVRAHLGDALAAVADCYHGERHRDSWLGGFSLGG